MLVTSILVAMVVALLIAINGVYVAAEFSTVSSHRPRLAHLADEGSRSARSLLELTESPHRLDTYIAACQLGITVSSLVLGYYGQSRVVALLAPQLAALGPAAEAAVSSVLATAVLLGLTVLQVVLGELVPKNLGVRHPEQLAIALWPTMRWSMLLFLPLIWLFNGSGRLALRLLGRQAVAEQIHIHSPEEILLLVEESSAGGVLDAEERRLLVNTLHLRTLTARKVMIPRNHMLAAPVDRPCVELFQLLAGSPYSRLPLYDETIDTVVGAIHLKDLLHLFLDEKRNSPCDARAVMHPVLHVPDSAPVEEVMDTMQREHYNIAIVVDEYGGTAGMITFEDLVEEIIGEFQDEFDVENPPLELRPNNRLRVRGDVLIDDLNEALDLKLPTGEVNTVGGLVLATIGRIPRAGDIAQVDDLPIRVDRVVNNSVAAVSIPVTGEQAARLRTLAGEF